MKKGTQVEILPPHENQGVQGFVFWTGPDRYNEELLRLGVKDQDGTAYWVNSDQVKALDGAAAAAGGGNGAARPANGAPRPAAAAPDGPAPERGSMVQWATGTGKVFWCGPSKFGDGIRVGVEDNSGEKHWLEAHQVTVIGAAPATSSAPRRRDDGDHGGYSNVRSASRSAGPSWDDGDPGPGDKDAFYANEDDIPF